MKLGKSILAIVILSVSSSIATAADLVVIGHPSAEPLTKDRVSDLFLGKGKGASLYDLPESSDLYAEFYEKATGRNVAQVKSTWSRLVFSGQAQAPKQLHDSAAVRNAVAEDARGIGYIERSALDGSVKVLLDLE
ncbi:hypothetical protein [Litchfieldella xinjiangensis]|uniref:hypothetical protein n=1 Tax=Litchfieldella xinjiangensis TaxID=1166948 RepID=UPI0005BA4E5B|nr:hypothetical protein [Halomonas xinjiangensis]